MIADELKNCRINISTTCSHNKSFQRSKSHTCVYAFSTDRCGDTCTITNVAYNNLCIFFSKKFYSFTRYEHMACSVETISSDAVFLIIFIWDCIHSCFLWNIHTKCCIEYCYIRFARHCFFASFNTDQVCRVMKRSEVEAVTNNFLHVFCYKCCITVYSTCMQYTVSDCCNLIRTFDHTMLFIL